MEYIYTYEKSNCKYCIQCIQQVLLLLDPVERMKVHVTGSRTLNVITISSDVSEWVTVCSMKSPQIKVWLSLQHSPVQSFITLVLHHSSRAWHHISPKWHPHYTLLCIPLSHLCPRNTSSFPALPPTVCFHLHSFPQQGLELSPAFSSSLILLNLIKSFWWQKQHIQKSLVGRSFYS